MPLNRYSSYGIDMVTGLNGNQAFRARITEITEQKLPCEIMIFGIDNFKHINDFYSYTYGDQVLKFFAEDMLKALGEEIELFRLDGDGFGVLFHSDCRQKIEEIFYKIQTLAQTPKHVGGLVISFTVSAGICQYPDDGDECDILYKNARIALSKAKSGNKKQCVFYQEQMSVQAQRDMLLMDKLKQSVEQDMEGFYLNFQPIMDGETKELYGCEALLRWDNPYFHTGISPFIFIPILENSGLILKVGRWVIENAFAVCKRWLTRLPNFQMNINVSAKQFEEADFVPFVLKKLEEYQLPHSSIVLELTESCCADHGTIREAFDMLRKQGVKTAFDDFGTGYASLDIFRNISGDELKVDKSFLERITYDVTDQVLLRTIIDMCRSMNIVVCVEGIENPEIERIVSSMNPHLLQGYLFNRPMAERSFEECYLRDAVEGKKEEEDTSSMVYSVLRPTKPMALSEIVDSAYAGIFQVGMDKDFSFLTCNEGYRRMLGYTAREIEEKFGNKALGFVHPDDVEWVNDEIRRQLGEGDTITIEFRIIRSDGQAIWILGTGNVVRSSDGNASLIVNIINNDANKRKTLERLAECDLYEEILNKIPTGVKYIQYEPNFTLKYISPGFLSIMGYTRQEIKELFADKYINLIYEEDRQKVFNDVLEQVKTSDVVTLRYRCMCKDGNLIWVETISRLCPPDASGMQYGCSSVVNVTETITEEQKLRSFNVANRFQLAAQRWGDVIFEYNFKTERTSFSESIATVLGYELSDGDHTTLDLIHDDDKELFYNTLALAGEGAEPKPIEVRMFKKDGSEIWARVLVTASDRIGNEAISVLGKISDVTEEHNEQERIRNELRKDSMTGLLNKAALEESIKETLCANQEGNYALFLLDADDFKKINDEHGHFVGDMVLETVAKRLKNTFRREDIIGRSGEDEFMVLMEYNGDRDVILNRGRKLVSTLSVPVQDRRANTFEISFSVGIAMTDGDGVSFSELFQKADSALYRVKKSGKKDFYLSGS